MTDGQDLMLNLRSHKASAGVSDFANIVVARLVASGGRHVLPLDDRMMTRFMEALQNADASVLENLRTDFRRAGVTPGDLADHYIPEAARRLGVEWLRDGLSFGEVSMASAKLQGLLRQVTSSFVEDERGEAQGGSVLVVVPEDEQHTLGALVLTSQLRRRGVSVNLQMGQNGDFLTKLVETRRFDGIMISISTTKQLNSCEKLSMSMRRGFQKPLPIAVGGSMIDAQIQAVGLTGVDIVSSQVGRALDVMGITAGPALRGRF